MLNRNSQNCKNCFELTALVGRYPFPQKIVMQKDDGGEEMLKLKSDRVNRFSHPQLEIGKNKKKYYICNNYSLGFTFEFK